MWKNRSKVQDQNMAEQTLNDLSPRFYDANGEDDDSLPNHDKHVMKALMEFNNRIFDAILGSSLLESPRDDHSDVPRNETVEMTIEKLKEIKLWGVPLMPSKRHLGTDIVLMKFLRSKNYNIDEALEKLKKTLIWRKEFNVDEILEESLGPDFEKIDYLDTVDREGRPLMYNIYGDLKENQMQYQKMLGSEENREKFLKWRIQYMEKCIEELNFQQGGADSVIQIIDWKDFQEPPPKEQRSFYQKCLTLLEEHYPEIIHQTIVINVPLWNHVSHSFSSRLTARTNSKTIFARPGKVTETLLKFISPENLLVEYGGLNRINDEDFSSEHEASELNLIPYSSAQIEILAPKVGVTIVWDVTVVGWEIKYKEEFVPEDEGSYQVLLQEMEKKGGDKHSIRNSYYINEAGKVVILIHNYMNKKKKIHYRYKTKPTVPMYLLNKT